jgi:hypothetical protein
MQQTSRRNISWLVIGVSLVTLLGFLWPVRWQLLLGIAPASWMVELSRLLTPQPTLVVGLHGFLFSLAILMMLKSDMRRVPG